MIRKNIITKLTAGFVFIVIISTLIIGIISINIFKNNIYKIKEKNITLHAQEFAKVLEPYIESNKESNDYKDILKIITNFDNTKAWVINLNGEIRTIKDNENIVIAQSSELKSNYSGMVKAALQGNIKEIQEYNDYYGENMMTVAVPINSKNNKILGAILVHSSMTDLSHSMDKFLIYLLAALLGEIFIAGLMGFYFSKNIMKPIKKINEAAIEMTRGNYKVKTNIYQHDEIGELSNSFDLLASKLQYNIGQLFLEKNKLSDIITSMKEGLIAVDKNYKIININNSTLELLNIKETQFDKINLDIIGIKEIVENSLKVNKKETIIKLFGNKSLNFSISPVLNCNKENTGVVIIIQDITEEEKLEKMRKDFIANVSHEFRTPLTIIRGNLEALFDGVISKQEIPQNYILLLQETKRLETMVKDLLELSKLEAGKVDLHFQYLDIKVLMQDIIRVLRPIIKVKNIYIELIAEDTLPPIWSDYDKLKQLLIIFIDNAIKFSSENSKVQLVIEIRDNICVTITDYGIGIPKEAISHIGERFYKVDKSRKYADKGTGLGISIARHLAQLLNCKLKVESRVNEGTKIEITFLKFKEKNSLKI